MKRLKLFMITVVLSLLSSCAIYHHYGPYNGKVVDETTKQPLEGAVVLVAYYTWLHASPGGPSGYFLDTQEVVTDKNGEFRIPSLNAFAFRPLSSFNDDPSFRIFKPRYACYRFGVPEDKLAIIELREVTTKEDRLRQTGCYPVSVPYKKMKQLIDQSNIERAELGVQPEFKEESAK